MNGHVPSVGVLGSDLQRSLLAAATDPDRQLGLHGARFVAGVRQCEVVTRKVGDVVVQQPAEALHALLELVKANLRAGIIDAVRVVLDLRPPCADPHLGASARQQIDGRDRLGQYRGMAIADRVDQ